VTTAPTTTTEALQRQVLLEFGGINPRRWNWKGIVFTEWTFDRFSTYSDLFYSAPDRECAVCSALTYSIGPEIVTGPQSFLDLANSYYQVPYALVTGISLALLQVFPLPDYEQILDSAWKISKSFAGLGDPVRVNYLTNRLRSIFQSYQSAQQMERLEKSLGVLWSADDLAASEGANIVESTSEIRVPLAQVIEPRILKEIKRSLAPKIAEAKEQRQLDQQVAVKQASLSQDPEVREQAEVVKATQDRTLTVEQAHTVSEHQMYRGSDKPGLVELWNLDKRTFVQIMQSVPVGTPQDQATTQKSFDADGRANKADLIANAPQRT